MAKSDYMRRMVDKTKRMGPVSSGWRLKHYLGLLGGTLWLAVILVELGWNLSALLATPDDGLKNPDGPKTILDCGRQATREGQVDPSCVSDIYGWLRLALVLNGMSIWWNPVMLRTANRAVGLGEFYRLQMLLFVMRFAAWHLLSTKSMFDRNATHGAHAVLLLLNLVVNTVCLRVAQPRVKRPVDFSRELPPLIEPGSLQDSTAPATRLAPAVPQSPAAVNRKTAFPISQLAGQPAPEPYKPPTPPPDLTFDDPDAMDVDQGPSQAASLYREQFSRTNAISSSFRTVQPPLPLKPGPAYNTRSRGRRPSPTKRGVKALPDWMSEAATSVADDDETLTVVDDDDESTVKYDQGFVPASARNRKDYDFAGPKLNVERDETGLEGMFKDIFGFGDDPLAATQRQLPPVTKTPGKTEKIQHRTARATVPGLGPTRQAHLTRSTKPQGHLLIPLITLPIFLLSFAASNALGVGTSVQDQAQTALLGWTAAIGAVRLFDALRPSRKYWELSNVLMYAVEAVLAVYLIVVRLQQLRLLGHVEREPATSTGPQDPVVMPDTEYLDDASGKSAAGTNIVEDSFRILDVQQVILVLLSWILIQEASIVFKNRQSRPKLV